MMIATNNWKYFKVGDIFPKKRFQKLSSTPEEEGTIPFVSSSSMNNGVSYYCNEVPIQGNCITVSTNGDCFDAFYQPNPVVISTDVDVLINDNLNECNAMFICTILRMEKFKWDYGRKPKNDKVFKTIIKLPVKSEDDTEPDWDYMTDFIKEMWISNLKDNRNKKNTIETKNWKRFPFKDIFDIEIGRGLPQTKESVQFCSCKDPNRILYVTRTDLNNGSVGFVLKDEAFSIEEGNAIIIGDTTATCFYQENEFITGDHIIVLRSSKMNKYSGLFISTMIKNEQYRFSYGRAFKKSLIESSSILLPQDSLGNIDWVKMEEVIKSAKYANLI